jgi:hypothetical protein
MYVTINVKSPNNTSKWQKGFKSAFKVLIGKTSDKPADSCISHLFQASQLRMVEHLDFLFTGMDLQKGNQTTCVDPYTVLVSLADPYTTLHVTGLEEDSGLWRCDAMYLRE